MAIYRFRKEELESQLNKGALWAIVYGDLMSYLMILFLLMFSYTLSNQKKRSSVEESLIEIQRIFGGTVDPRMAARAKQRDLEMLITQNLKTRAQEGQLGGGTEVIVSEKRITLNLGDRVLFASGQATLKKSAGPVLKAIAGDMLSVDNEIRVEGHTDSVRVGKRSKYRSNWELSMARAYAVIQQLEKNGVAPKRLSGIGYGEHRPIASNKTKAGRAKNRRIEISLLREE